MSHAEGRSTATIADAPPACPVSQFAQSFDPFEDAYLQDPYSVFARARREEPVFYAPGIDYWVVSRYDDVHAVLADKVTFSADEATRPLKDVCPAAGQKLAEAEVAEHPYLVNEDDPVHTPRRMILRQKLTPKEVAKLEPKVRQFVTQYLDAIVARGRADLVDDLVYEVPALTALLLMGVSDGEAREAKTMASRFALWIWGRPDEDEQVALAEDFVRFYDFAREHVKTLFEHPGDDYISNAIRLSREQGKEDLFSPTYLYAIMQGHLYAGHETTTNAAANGFKALLEHPDQWELLCQDPKLIPNAVEEILRYQSSVPVWRRRARVATTIGGVDVPADARIMLLTASANHDDAMFGDGERFDVRRDDARKHLAFGWGKHRCLGEGLARMEMRVILEETTRRLPHMRLVEGQSYEYSPNTSFRGPFHVLAEWDPSENPVPADRPRPGRAQDVA
jgi:cytochrome P450